MTSAVGRGVVASASGRQGSFAQREASRLEYYSTSRSYMAISRAGKIDVSASVVCALNPSLNRFLSNALEAVMLLHASRYRPTFRKRLEYR